jgi:hypothetical protein
VRVSRDKVNKVAHVVTDALAEIDAVDFVEDRNTIRLEVRKILEDLLNQEAKIDQAARLKIESQKRTILEGSQEWDILYRKYYNEEVKKLGFRPPVVGRLSLVFGRPQSRFVQIFLSSISTSRPFQDSTSLAACGQK